MNMKKWILAAVCALAWHGAAHGQAGDDPLVVLRGGVNEVLDIAYGDSRGPDDQPLSERVRPVLERYFDLAAVTRRAVGPGWKQLKSDEQTKVIDLFSTLVLRTYADSFEPGQRPEIKYGAVTRLSATRMELPTTIVYAGQNYAVAYRMEKSAAGWRIYDVNIEGVSMVANYRAQFEALLQKGGAGALIESLEQNVRSAAKKS